VDHRDDIWGAQADCVSFNNCAASCENGGQGAGGGGSACVKGEGKGDGGAGGASNMCISCCETSNATGYADYTTDLVLACACQPGATCLFACECM